VQALSDGDQTALLAERMREASAAGTALRIVGGDTRRWYGRPVDAAAVALAGHHGVINYDPGELVLTVRSGTPLAEVEALLRAHGQCLPFEPPRFGMASTIGGTIAAGLAGPARVARGPVRDYMLGARLLTGDGRVLRFGGEVMKNVAGYDVARLLAGSLGILGVIMDVSLKVLPRHSTLTLQRACNAIDALDTLARAALSGVPITASCWCADQLNVRLEGSAFALQEIVPALGGSILPDDAAETFWLSVRDQRHAFFAHASTLWRISVPALAPLAPAVGTAALLLEWNGSQRWYANIDHDAAHALARAGGGFATRFRASQSLQDAALEVFAPLPDAVMALHRSLKRVFDPAGVCNPGRMYAGL
jgi:glycolate oxidase FAD binding subunit